MKEELIEKAKEEIKKFSIECADNIEYATTSQEFSRDDRIEIGKALYNLGYRKQVWHKVADGDLPEYAGSYLVICGDESLPEYDVDFYENFYKNFRHDKRWTHNEGRVIAWAELPKYEE